MNKKNENVAMRSGWGRWHLFFVAVQCVVLMGGAVRGIAVPASPAPTLVRQPDGTEFMMYQRGDEFLHWDEDRRGYTVLKDRASGYWKYARQNSDGKLMPSTLRPGRDNPGSLGVPKSLLPAGGRDRARAKRSEVLKKPRSLPQRSLTGGAPVAAVASSTDEGATVQGTTGTMKNLVLLLEFSDLPQIKSTNDFDALFNEIGYNTDGAVGSVKDYYKETSYNTLTVDSVITEWITLDHGYAYYGADVDGWDVRPQEMVSEGLAKLEASGFDFSTVDGDSDGYVDGLTVIHSGWGQEWTGNSSDYIWSHKWSLTSYVQYGGKWVYDYHTEPELRGASGTYGITRIGVICHENGHFLGLPDLYDYDNPPDDSQGAGDFAIMAGGSWNGTPGQLGNSPAHFCAWSKKDLGWVTPTVITMTGRYTLPRVEDNATIFRLNGAPPFSSDEYFLMENRQGVGFDATLPGSTRGMLIWHVDDGQSNNDDQTHYKVDLEEASGTQELELGTSSGDDNDYYRAGNATTFTDSTTPNSDSYGGRPLGKDVTNVSASGSNMWVDVVAGTTYSLQVISAHGSPDPSVGTHYYGSGQSVTNSVSSPVDVGTTRYLCSGWSMPAHVPTSGSTTSFVMTITGNAVLTWNWTTNYWLDTSTSGFGSVSVADAWYASGAAEDIGAVANPQYTFSHWTGDVPSGHENDNPLSVTMDQARALTAVFIEAPGPNSTNGVPYSASFEAVAVGSALPGTNGWSAATLASALVTNDAAIVAAFDAYGATYGTPLSEGHSRYLAVSSDTTNAVVSLENSVVYVDALMQALRMQTLPEVDEEETVQLAMAFDASGHPEVFHYDPGDGSNRWTVLDSITLEEDAVVRVTLCCDYHTEDSLYGRRYFKLWINGELATHTRAYSANDGSGSAGGSWFAMPANTPPTQLSSVEIKNRAVIDEVVITPQNPYGANGSLFGLR